MTAKRGSSPAATRGRVARRPAGVEGDRRGLRARRGGQDHDGGRGGGHGRRPPRGARSSSSPSTPPAGWPTPSGSRVSATPSAASPRRRFVAAGVKPMGELWAAMLDTKESWDSLIRLHAPDERTRDEILANPLYRNISGRFVQSHDYIAMERLFEIHAEGNYDLIVVDTPPTRNALDFLDAPERMAEFFSSRLLRWLIVPYRSRLVNFASKPFYQIADRILGTQFLADIAEFFILFQSMYDGFVERARPCTASWPIGGPRSSSSPRSKPCRCARRSSSPRPSADASSTSEPSS